MFKLILNLVYQKHASLSMPFSKRTLSFDNVLFLFTQMLMYSLTSYLIPPPAGAAGVSSLILATQASVVRNVDATLEGSAERFW